MNFEGTCFSWGKNNQGQCGHPVTCDIILPQQIGALANEVVIRVAGGWEHTLALTEDGRVFSYGSGIEPLCTLLLIVMQSSWQLNEHVFLRL